MNPSAIVIGASSGIGAALAADLSASGYTVGIAARRADELKAVASRMRGPVHCKVLDLSDVNTARDLAQALIAEMGGVDLFVIVVGIGRENHGLDWPPEAETIAVNVTGFTAMATLAIQYFVQRGKGHLVGISSVAAIRGHGYAPSYGASKAFVSSYLRSLRHKVSKHRLPICVTDIQAGLVDTAMAKGEGLFWVAPVHVASSQIMKAIHSRRTHAYVTKRWRLIAWLLRIMPDWIYHRS